jgi:hypothetical protein
VVKKSGRNIRSLRGYKEMRIKEIVKVLAY